MVAITLPNSIGGTSSKKIGGDNLSRAEKFKLLESSSTGILFAGHLEGAIPHEDRSLNSFSSVPMNINTTTFFGSGYAISGPSPQIPTDSLLGQVEALLHEVAHEVGAIPNDAGSPGTSQVNSITINAVCQTAIQQLTQ